MEHLDLLLLFVRHLIVLHGSFPGQLVIEFLLQLGLFVFEILHGEVPMIVLHGEVSLPQLAHQNSFFSTGFG